MRRGTGVILFTFVLMYVLMILPLPEWAQWAWPEWVTMSLIYWTIVLPSRVGILTGWILGLGLDILLGTVLGEHALALALVAYLSLVLHRRVRVYPLWQQSFIVFLLIGMQLLVVRIVQAAVGTVPSSLLYWLPCLVSAFAWPFFSFILNALRYRFAIS
ncbi:MAG TPA: rod shape-determining protein MreD [Pseudomonadales bacterium]